MRITATITTSSLGFSLAFFKNGGPKDGEPKKASTVTTTAKTTAVPVKVKQGQPSPSPQSSRPFDKNEIEMFGLDLALAGDDVMGLYEWEAKKGFRV